MILLFQLGHEVENSLYNLQTKFYYRWRIFLYMLGLGLK